MTMRQVLAPVLLVVLLAGCGGGDVLTLGADEIGIPACSPGQTVDVETLDTAERPECTPLGSELLFPDGTRLAMGEYDAAGSSSTSESDYSHGWYDVGVYGIVASHYDSTCQDLEIWGRAEAIEKLRAAFGDAFGNC